MLISSWNVNSVRARIENVKSYLLKYKPDEIYNIAAQSHVRVSFDTSENTVDGIAMGTLRILNAAKAIVPNAKIYQASSSEMFGDNPENPQPSKLRKKAFRVSILVLGASGKTRTSVL